MVGDAHALPFSDQSFDHAFLVAVLGEVTDRDKALDELYRVLRPGGILSITEMLPDPDYSLKGTTIAPGRRARFEPYEEYGNFFIYTVNFKRG